MKHLLYFLFYFTATSLSAQTNTLVILGKTNVNTFKCTNTGFNHVVDLDSKSAQSFSLAVDDFDCRNRMMTSNFRKTLHADTHPKMSVKFIKLRKINTSNYYAAQIEVRLMNRAKLYDVTFFSDDRVLQGSKTVKFSDFGITPPKRMGGTIQVKDTLDLSFSLLAKS